MQPGRSNQMRPDLEPGGSHRNQRSDCGFYYLWKRHTTHPAHAPPKCCHLESIAVWFCVFKGFLNRTSAMKTSFVLHTLFLQQHIKGEKLWSAFFQRHSYSLVSVKYWILSKRAFHSSSKKHVTRLSHIEYLWSNVYASLSNIKNECLKDKSI